MATPNDAITVLNPGAGGDSMNDTISTQSDGVTRVKSERIVQIDDNGAFIARGNPLDTTDVQALEVLEDIRDLLRQLVRLNGGLA